MKPIEKTTFLAVGNIIEEDESLRMEFIKKFLDKILMILTNRGNFIFACETFSAFSGSPEDIYDLVNTFINTLPPEITDSVQEIIDRQTMKDDKKIHSPN